MSNYSALKTDINNNIYENNTQQITGTVLNTVLKDMVNTLGAGYQFAGCAYLDLNPGAPDAKVFYLAGEGLYTNFDNIQVPAGKLGILKWDTRWRLETIEGLGGGGANLTGYISVASTDDLPDEGQPTIGYLCGTNLYLYVGEGGDTKEGKYQDCGAFRGPEGVGITEIEQVEQSTENGGRNTIRIHLSNGSSYDVYTRNGTTSTGLFPTLEALQAAYPSPVVGQYAFVGAGFPADIYVCNTAGTWTDSGADYDGDSVDLTNYATKAELNQLEAKVDELAEYDNASSGMDAETPQDAIDELAAIDFDGRINLSGFTARRWYIGTGKGDTISETTDGSAYSVKVPCVPGNLFLVKVSGGNGGRAWYVLDSSDKILALADANFVGEATIEVPANGAYFIAQTNNSSYALVVKNYIHSLISKAQNGVDAINKTLLDNFLISRSYDRSAATANRWYTGTSIGGTLTETTTANTYSLKITVSPNEIITVTLKGGSGGRAWYVLDSSDKVLALSNSGFDGTEQIIMPTGAASFIAQTNAWQKFSVVIGSVNDALNGLRIEDERIKENLSKTAREFTARTANYFPQLARLLGGENVFVNVMLVGDSWTQGIPTNNIQVTYSRNLCKILQDKYGYGGLGWIDFARDGGNGDMFGAADGYEHFSYQFAGTLTGLDGSAGPSVAQNCLGVCCGHTIFSNGASLSLTFDAGKLDVFKLRYYKDAHFNVSVNGGTPTEITANSTDGWQETSFGVTGTDITSVVITSLADDSIIFGMDCFYGEKGIRVHKVGNRSINANDYLYMPATQWQDGIKMLEPSWASVMLEINDLGNHTEESYYSGITQRVQSLLGRIATACTENSVVPCDLNVLGISGIKAAGYTGLSTLENSQKEMAFSNGYGFASTMTCIGSDKTLMAKYGLFLTDGIHLNEMGSAILALHIARILFTP